MKVQLGKIVILDWEKNGDQNWYRPTEGGDDNYGTAVYIFKITQNKDYKEYVPGFFGKLEFLKEQYKIMYGDKRFRTLHEAKDNADVFLNRISNLKVFL